MSNTDKNIERCNLSNDDLIAKVKEWVSKLSITGGQAWTLRVPVDFNHDPDMLIIELCNRLSPVTHLPPPESDVEKSVEDVRKVINKHKQGYKDDNGQQKYFIGDNKFEHLIHDLTQFTTQYPAKDD